MDRHNAALPCLCLGSAGHSAGHGVNIRRRQRQQLTDPPAAVNKDQRHVHPWFRLMIPQPGDLLVSEPGTCCFGSWRCGQQIGVAAGDDVHLQGEAVQVAPQVFDCRLGAGPSPAAINGILHLKRLD